MRVKRILRNGDVVVAAAMLYRVRATLDPAFIIGELLEQEEALAMVASFNDCRPKDPAEAITYADLASQAASN